MTRDWKAVATAIDQRLAELGLELRELARRSMVSESILRELRYNSKERRRSSRTLSSISTALGWPPEYLDNVLNGTPVPLEESDSSLDARLESIDRRLDEMHSLLTHMAKEVSDLRRSGGGERDAGR